MFASKKRLTYPDIQFFTENIKRYFGGVFYPRRDILIVRAPGRLDIMGGIAEDFGSTSLSCTLQEALVLGLQQRTDRKILVRSIGIEDYGLQQTVEFNLDDFYRHDRPKPFSEMKRFFAKDATKSWITHVAGVFYILLKEGIISSYDYGVNIGIQSSIPCGMGVASSAALKIASMGAILQAYNITLSEIDIVNLCRLIESKLVGNNISSTDLVTTLVGESDEILSLRNQPGEVIEKISLPKGFRFVGINSMVRHPKADSRSVAVRTSTILGFNLIADHVRRTEFDNNPFLGYLCNITPEDFEVTYKGMLPGRISGEEFCKRLQINFPKNLDIIPNKYYRIQNCVKHVIYENERAQSFFKHLTHQKIENQVNMETVGRLMYESHNSYVKNCGLSTKETDLLVSLIKERGPTQGLYGAKTTNSDNGGTVAILAACDTDDVLYNISAQYYDATGIQPQLLLGSSPGALPFGSFTTSFE